MLLKNTNNVRLYNCWNIEWTNEKILNRMKAWKFIYVSLWVDSIQLLYAFSW